MAFAGDARPSHHRPSAHLVVVQVHQGARLLGGGTLEPAKLVVVALCVVLVTATAALSVAQPLLAGRRQM